LLLVGLYFWIPPLFKAVFGSTRTAQAESANAPVSSEVLAAARAAAANQKPSNQTITWENAETLLASDPLLRSADLAEMNGNPFTISHDQFSPPVLFAEEEPEGPKKSGKSTAKKTTTRSVQGNASAAPKAPQERSMSGLVLKSTILGTTRRAALINDKLYTEGSSFEWNGETYLLAAVRQRQVELRKGEEAVLLELPGLNSTEGIRIERVESSPLQPN